jgi:hypothetical protein
LGALAYVLVEMMPEWFGSVQGQKACRHVVNTLDPSKRYRALTEQLEIADTIANRAALAEECLELRKFTEAESLRAHSRAADGRRPDLRARPGPRSVRPQPPGGSGRDA